MEPPIAQQRAVAAELIQVEYLFRRRDEPYLQAVFAMSFEEAPPIRIACVSCGGWIELIQPRIVQQSRGIWIPDDWDEWSAYCMAGYEFERRHHNCYMDTGKRTQWLTKDDAQFDGLDSNRKEN